MPKVPEEPKDDLGLRQEFTHACLSILALGTAALVVFFLLGQFHDYPKFSTEQYLKQLAGVSAVNVSSFDDGIQVKTMFAEVSLTGTDSRRIRFSMPHGPELRTGTHLRIDVIGRYNLMTDPPRGRRQGWVDIGSEGPFSNLLPFRVQSAADLVMQYDEVVGFIERLPTSFTHVAPNGETYTLSKISASIKLGADKGSGVP
jgi:hypothetical protein